PQCGEFPEDCPARRAFSSRGKELQMRFGAGPCDPDRPQEDSRCDQEKAGPTGRQVSEIEVNGIPMSLLAVGSIAFDSIRTPYGEAEEILGGSATFFAVTASWFTSVSVVAVVG